MATVEAWTFPRRVKTTPELHLPHLENIGRQYGILRTCLPRTEGHVD